MSISRQNLSVVIVTFNSEKVVYDCIDSIPREIKIVIVDNSNDKEFKENIEKKYDNLECILSSENLGMGSGNNLGLSKVKVITDFVTLFESKDVSYMKSTPKGKFVFYLCSTACDRLKKKEDGVIALDSSIAKCSHEHLVKKSSGSFYRKFHVNPDNIDINSVSYKTTSAKQAIEGVEARV